MTKTEFSYGKTSSDRLATCHPDLQRLCNELIKHRDVTIVCGQRGEQEQNRAFAMERSCVQYPDSKHNKTPSMAVDMAIYHKGSPHIQWDNHEEFLEFSGFVKGVAATLGLVVVWGGDWHSFKDLPHWELV